MKPKGNRFIRALGWNFLTPLYDPLVRLAARELKFKTALLNQGRLDNDTRILDVGCGTGTLLLLAKQQSASVRSVGLDGDPGILSIAASKAAEARQELCLVLAYSYAIPFRDGAFDRVISSLMLHHLTRSEKLATLGEMRRVLRPGGELDVADWGRPHNFLMVLLSWTVRLGDQLGRTVENLKGLLPDLFRDAGFSDVAETMRFATVFGTLQLYRGRRPGVDRSQNAA